MYRYIYSVAKKYPVRLPDGSYTKFANGGKITKVVPIIGYGTNKELGIRFWLESNYHIDSSLWTKYRGECYIFINHSIHRVEVHWYEANGYRCEIKLKYDFDEEA